VLSKLAPLNVVRMMSHAEEPLKGYARMAGVLLNHGVLEPALRELVILRVGHLTGSDYELQQHGDLSRRIGVPEPLIEAVGRGGLDPAFDVHERAALIFVDDVVKNAGASEETLTALLVHYTFAEAIELTLVTGFYQMTAGFLKSFDVDLETSPSLGDTMRRRAQAGASSDAS
jgi:alkylhydroperoxidase family enzyme